MKTERLIPTIIFAVLLPLAAAAECERPWPVEVPDGATASKEEMLEAQKAVKDYLARADEYLLCLEEEEAAVKVDAEDPEAVQAAAEEKVVRARRHNAAVDEMEQVAEQFNQTVRAYKARNSAE